jgi:nucleoside-diphosphate-sugar epimerase
MRVLIAGATGVLGRRVVARLVRAGHQVVAACRSEDARARAAALGADARRCDLFSASEVASAAAGCDAVLHLATAIPNDGRARTAWAENDRIRTDGTRALVDGAERAGCAHYLQQSVAFLYAAPPLSPILRSAVVMEEIVRASRLAATILRFGAFYCADSGQTRDLVARVRRKRMFTIGDGSMYWSLIHVDDAAAACVAALAAPPGQYDVVDDEPVTMRALVDEIARLCDAPRPKSVPRLAARIALGRPIYRTLAASLRVDNAAAKAALGWKPAFPTYREGYAAVVKELG